MGRCTSCRLTRKRPAFQAVPRVLLGADASPHSWLREESRCTTFHRTLSLQGSIFTYTTRCSGCSFSDTGRSGCVLQGRQMWLRPMLQTFFSRVTPSACLTLRTRSTCSAPPILRVFPVQSTVGVLQGSGKFFGTRPSPRFSQVDLWRARPKQ
jgi:hypothetical protein